MADAARDPAEEFTALCAAYADRPGVSLPDGTRRFGSSALKVNGAIFAMLVSDELVVKLPAARVAGLIEDGLGTPFLSGRGTPMREWVQLAGHADVGSLAAEAYTFVGRTQH